MHVSTIHFIINNLLLYCIIFYLSGAQEEIILFNSDGYRALLDLKYGRMGGGYAIPEFGLAYVRDICFVNKETGKERKADMIVSACYCLSPAPQLYDNPTTEQEVSTLSCYNSVLIILVDNKKCG
jgi:hypothetical protein